MQLFVSLGDTHFSDTDLHLFGRRNNYCAPGAIGAHKEGRDNQPKWDVIFEETTVIVVVVEGKHTQ